MLNLFKLFKKRKLISSEDYIFFDAHEMRQITSKKVYTPTYEEIKLEMYRAATKNGVMRIEFDNAIINSKVSDELEEEGYTVFCNFPKYDKPHFVVRWDL